MLFLFPGRVSFAHGAGSTFNEITLTNGYHPLWMLICSAVFATGLGKFAALHVIAAIIVLLNIGTLCFVVGVLRRIGVTQWQLGGAILISFLFDTELGSEGAVSAFFLSAFLFAAAPLAQQFSARRFVLANILLDFALLSRLDNVFVCVLMGLGLLTLAFSSQKSRALIAPICIAGALHALILGSYLATNIIYFGTLLPISGALKNSGNDVHAFGSNLPHIAKAALIINIVCVAYLIYRRNRNIIYHIFVPFVLGTVLHAGFILLFMSSETHWSWYYTSWMLLAALLISIAMHQLLADAALNYSAAGSEKIQMAALVAACVLPLAWAAKELRYKFLPTDATWIAQLEAAVPAEQGVKRVLAFDFPGKIAYYSSLQVLSADGLTEDLKFQRDLAREGMLPYLARRNVKVLVGPPALIPQSRDSSYCGRVYLGSTRFTCIDSPDGKIPTKVEFFSRVPFKSVGNLDLQPEKLVWSGRFAAWRID